MPPLPYDKLSEKELILRDVLAADRTILANERTLLAYIRTALAFALTGAGALKFFDSSISTALGWASIASGLVIGLIGFWRYQRIRAVLAAVQDITRNNKEQHTDIA